MIEKFEELLTQFEDTLIEIAHINSVISEHPDAPPSVRGTLRGYQQRQQQLTSALTDAYRNALEAAAEPQWHWVADGGLPDMARPFFALRVRPDGSQFINEDIVTSTAGTYDRLIAWMYCRVARPTVVPVREVSK